MNDPQARPAAKRGHGRQLLGSLLAALLIVAAAIWAVTARLGPTSIAELEAKEEAAEEKREEAEEAKEEEEEAAEEKEEPREERSGRRRRGRDR
jgi:flagellar biosynthesis/type III secretory pathway M-ring protein FliF/YscJ